QIITTYGGYLGVPTDELNCMHFLNMLLGYLDDGAAMPYHRSHELSSALCDVIYKNGGEIYYNTEVTEFLYNEDGSMRGVVAGGQTYLADEIISNIIANNVINRSDITKIPERTLRLANARELGISVATMYLGLDCTAEELGFKDYTVFVTTTPDAREQYEKRREGTLYILNCLNNVIPDCTPEGTCMLFFTMPIFGSDIPKDLTPETYKKYKNAIAKKFIEDAEKTFGIDIKSHIEEISVATPVTFARYLGTPEGTIYGYYTADWDNVIMRVSEEAKDFPTPGMSYCGGHATRGDGYSCALITGMNAGKKVAKRVLAKKGGNN
ncbi:MAG: NAD(P)/FAD-dependent oxidoreductase, partial [Clostridia bacterium]|nr:NAD(P)/FAD-dependent oxidoreductase [Clostridia bacterium]